MKVVCKFREVLGRVMAVPVYPSGEQEFYKMLGKTKTITVNKSRNKKHHDYFLAKLRMVAGNSEQWKSPESLLVSLKWTVGYVEEVTDMRGHKYVSPKSINWETIDEDEFSDFEVQCDPFLASALKCSIETLNDPNEWEQYL